jgi:hypothetical protein
MKKMRSTIYLAVAAGFVVLQAVVLWSMGRPPICTCGAVRLWYGDLAGSGMSQHITDWYTFTHITHGFLFYLLLTLAAPRSSLYWRLAIAVGIEATWEMVENSPFIIDRYRQQALAQGYVGDSIVNSLSDTASAVLGFFLASALSVRASVAAVVCSELLFLYLIRDNLLLNIIQLVHPIDAISAWQATLLGKGPHI